MARRCLVRLSVAVVLVATAAPADDDAEPRIQSRAAFRRGVAALEKEQWPEARAAFGEAYKLFPHPSILLNLGIAQAHGGDLVEAEQDLSRFLTEDTTARPDEIETARKTLEGVRGELGTVRVRVLPVGATARIDGKPIALVANDFLAVRVTRGRHLLEATAQDHAGWTGHVVVLDASPKEVDLTLPLRPTPTARSAGFVLGPPRVAAIVLGAVAVTGAGFATYAGLHSIDLANQYNTPGQQNFQNPGTKSEGIDYRTVADVTFAVAGALLVTAVVLFIAGPALAAHQARASEPPGVTLRF